MAPIKQTINGKVLRFLMINLQKRGYNVVGEKAIPPDYDKASIDLYHRVQPYTLTSHERVFALRQAVTYVVESETPGAIVECGVWRGGSMLAIALTLLELGRTDRDLYLFDTFETMPPPGEEDVDVWGVPAADTMEAALASPVYTYIPQEQIKQLLVDTGYPEERLHFVKGMVEDTIPEHAPGQIALCRLDTDWYESTAHEMEHLYPRIPPNGILLVDDYGHYLGSRKAVDEYIDKHDLKVLLNRIDMTGRLVIVPPQ